MLASTFIAPLYATMVTAALAPRQSCTDDMKIAASMAEIKTIKSHSADDAALIPLAPDATRTFIVTPDEAPFVALPVNVGLTADTVRLELVVLATVLNAGVPEGSVSYMNNPNGTLTTDFIQTDLLALPAVHVREIYDFNDECQITTILGYVHGPLTNITAEALCELTDGILGSGC